MGDDGRHIGELPPGLDELNREQRFLEPHSGLPKAADVEERGPADDRTTGDEAKHRRPRKRNVRRERRLCHRSRGLVLKLTFAYKHTRSNEGKRWKRLEELGGALKCPRRPPRVVVAERDV